MLVPISITNACENAEHLHSRQLYTTACQAQKTPESRHVDALERSCLQVRVFSQHGVDGSLGSLCVEEHLVQTL